MNLSLFETRVIGALVEKEITTPDQYPLSLNSLTTACNQKSNRDPVLSMEETEVQETLDELLKKRLVSEVVVGSRVTKYKHRFCNTEFSELQLNSRELACMTCLFLRGPQTPGELRTRTNRLCQFSDVQEVEQTLQGLIDREAGALVVKLGREPGKRESRYAHLLSGEVEQNTSDPESHVSSGMSSDSEDPATQEKVERLEQELAELKAEVNDLKEQVNILTELME